MNIFLITSVPLVPPWDQGDKNIAYALTGALPQHRFSVLTARNEAVPPGDNLDLVPAYRGRRPSLLQKIGVYGRLLSPPIVHGANGVDGHPPDLYHLIYQPYPLSSWLSHLLPEYRRRPTLHTVPATAQGRPMDRRLFFADRVVTISEYGRRALQELGLENVVHIPPGIPVAPWKALQGQGEFLKARLGLAAHPLVLFPGHYGPGQGSEVLLEALPRLAVLVPEARILLACRLRSADDAEREKAFRQQIRHLGLGHMAHFYNTVADVRTLVGASDLMLLPLETMRDKSDIPIALLESLAAGKPIVITDVAPMNELVTGSEGSLPPEESVGLTVPAGDGEALAQAVATLLKDAGLREGMARRGQELVHDRFDIARVALQYEELYSEMVR